MKTLLILGGTGQVGQQLVRQALQNPAVGKVIAPTRQPLPAHEKLLNPQINFEQLPVDADWWHADAVLSALGTTRKLAGSNEAFHRIDHDFVINAAHCALKAGTPVFVNNSAVGANAKSGSFYLRTKSEIETDLNAMGFASVCHVRPALLDTTSRKDFRWAEFLSIAIFRGLRPLIPARYRSVSPARVASRMLVAALAPAHGVSVIESEAI